MDKDLSMNTQIKVAIGKQNGADSIQIVDSLQNTDWKNNFKEAAKGFPHGGPLHSSLFSTDIGKLARKITFSVC